MTFFFLEIHTAITLSRADIYISVVFLLHLFIRTEKMHPSKKQNKTPFSLNPLLSSLYKKKGYIMSALSFLILLSV